MRAGIILLIGAGGLLAQSGTVVAALGYSAPAPIEAAPGQIVTVFVKTQQTLSGTLAATGVPLPRSLGPFEVRVRQTVSASDISAPIVSAAPVTDCASPIPGTCAPLTAITIQIPFELYPNVPDSRQPENFAALTVLENGVAGQPIALHAAPDRIHILTSCDVTRAISPPCLPDIRHADGAVVTSANPAAPGETLTLLAYGIGQGSSVVATGAASPSPTVPVSDVLVGFRYGTGQLTLHPATVEFVPGEVGLYRATFQAPALTADASPCSAANPNLSVFLSRSQSSDSAAICIEGPVPPAVGRSPRPRN
jgi:uncharacterized protein (TIGR03437 family)